jgi:predicted  nucleic acid-binding Zn-ribbon protein
LDSVLTSIRAKHASSDGGLPAKSTCGIVLDGVSVNIIVPGGPAWRHPWDKGEDHVSSGDVILKVDGEPVDRKSVIAKLRGDDVPGSKVTLTLKRGEEDEHVVTLERASMRSTMNLKDLYLAIDELRSAAADPERLDEAVTTLLKRVDSVVEYERTAGTRLYSHVAELEKALITTEEEAKALRTSSSATAGAAASGADKGKEELRGQVRVLEQELRAIRAAGPPAQSAQGAAARPQGEHERAQRDAAALRDEVQALRAAADAAGARTAQLERELKAAVESRAVAQEGCDQAAAHALKLERTVVELQQEDKRMRRQLESAQGQARRDAESAGGQAAALARELEEEREHAAGLKKETVALREEVGARQFELSRAETEAAQLRSKLKGLQAEADAARAEAGRALADAQRARDALKDAVAQSRDLATQVASLDAALAGKDARGAAAQRAVAAEVDDLRKSNLSLREERRKAQDERARMQAELASLKAAPRIEVVESGRSKELEAQLQQLRREHAQLEAMLAAAQAGAAQAPAEGAEERAAARRADRERHTQRETPLFNGRTDDIHHAAGAAVACLLTAKVIWHVQSSYGRDGGMMGLVVVVAVLFAVVFTMLTVFKALLIAFPGAPPRPLCSLDPPRSATSLRAPVPPAVLGLNARARRHADPCCGCVEAEEEDDVAGQPLRNVLVEAGAPHHPPSLRESHVQPAAQGSGGRASWTAAAHRSDGYHALA